MSEQQKYRRFEDVVSKSNIHRLLGLEATFQEDGGVLVEGTVKFWDRDNLVRGALREVVDAQSFRDYCREHKLDYTEN